MLEAIILAGALHGASAAHGTPARNDPILRPGARGSAVVTLQRRLHRLGYAPGAVTGRYGKRTVAAVWAFQKANRIRPDSIVRPRTWAALDRPHVPKPIGPRRRANRVEIDLSRQLLLLYRRGRPVLISHVSTGAPGMRTPRGDYRVYRRVGGWHRSPLGGMYRPLFFHRGYAMHGSLSVPLHPASHGCVRLPVNAADRVAELVRIGDPVYVRR